MLDLHPFTGHVVVADHAPAVVTPPYDAIPVEVRTALAASDPDSYLGALPPASVGPAELEVALARCRTHLTGLLLSGRYRRLPGPVLGVLAFGAPPHRSVAVAGDVPVTAFRDGRILPHEDVRADRVDELARYLEVVGVASSPVAVTQLPHAEVTAATAPVLDRTPDVAFRDDDGLDLAFWAVTEGAEQRALAGAIAAAGTAFVADGHHRAAAAAAYAERAAATDGSPATRVLTAVLPSDHLVVAPFHRRVDGALTPAPSDDEIVALLDRLRAADLEPEPLDERRLPPAPGHLVVAAGGRWWAVDATHLARHDDPVETLDVRLVERVVLPALTAEAPHAVISPVASPFGLNALVRPGAVGVALHPPEVAAILAVAAAGRTLPAKTTYVTPKLRSGLVVTPRTP